MDNRVIARRLNGEAREMEARPEMAYSVKAFRKAAELIEETGIELEWLWRTEGIDSLQKLPGIGPGIAERIAGYLRFETTMQQLKAMAARN
jgi:DNA polymerase (family X)